MWKHYHIIENFEQLTAYLADQQGQTKIISGGTDLMVELRNGKWPDLDTVLDISRIHGLDQIWRDEEGLIHIQTLVTHNDVTRSPILREHAFPLVQACSQVATPQLRNRGTVVGNLVTGSPANDTITPLMALDASLVLVSRAGERLVRLQDFYEGIRKTVLHKDEFVREVVFQSMRKDQKGCFKKSALRRTQAISVLNCCVILDLDGEIIKNAMITLGSVAPTIIHAQEAETFLYHRALTIENIQSAAKLASQAAMPITDLRGSQSYRSYMLSVLVENALMDVLEDKVRESVPTRLATLDTREGFSAVPASGWDGDVIQTTINGEEYSIVGFSDQTLLNMVREKVGLVGTKVGCEEGECGACTLFLDGKAVVSCLVPAPRAHCANITTIEGIAKDDKLHPVQQAFIDHAAVQCGYCTPGFVMSAVKLLDEIPEPSRETIRKGISGNLCRCTGYYKIVEAIESASMKVER